MVIPLICCVSLSAPNAPLMIGIVQQSAALVNGLDETMTGQLND